MAERYRDRSYAADDNYGRGARHVPSPEENDPLAELARLIGQTDPFSNFGLEHKSAPQRHAPAQPRNEPPRYADEAINEPFVDEPQPTPPAWMRNRQAAQHAEPDYGQQDRYDPPPARFAHEDPGFPPRYDQPAPYDDPYAAQQRFDQGHYDAHARYDSNARYDDVLYGQPPADRYPEPPYDDDPRYAADGYADDGYMEEQPARSRRGGMMTVGAVLALAVLGTVGAYAYRSFVGSPRSGEPPIIKADAGPNKIVPANSQSGEGKQIYDRVGDRTGERMVSREEQPVEVNSQTGPRVVFPPLTQNASPPTTAAVSPAARPTGPGVANGTLSGEEPRRIRTLSIRPDQPDVVVPAAAAQAARQAPPPAAAPRPAPAAANVPMALTPQAQDTAASQSAPRARVASVNPSAAAPAAGGAYVQLSSQKSEADALASYKVLQGKYPGILGSRSASVRRADLGSKGIYYRALVGPFGTNEEATQFCVNLQSAGGKCIVQRN